MDSPETLETTTLQAVLEELRHIRVEQKLEERLRREEEYAAELRQREELRLLRTRQLSLFFLNLNQRCVRERKRRASRAWF